VILGFTGHRFPGLQARRHKAHLSSREQMKLVEAVPDAVENVKELVRGDEGYSLRGHQEQRVILPGKPGYAQGCRHYALPYPVPGHNHQSIIDHRTR